MAADTEDPDLIAALKGIYDPEIGMNIVDLGLVYLARRTSDEIHIAMTMTSPSCPMGEMLTEDVRARLRALFPHVASIKVELVWDPPWSPDRMKQAFQ